MVQSIMRTMAFSTMALKMLSLPTAFFRSINPLSIWPASQMTLVCSVPLSHNRTMTLKAHSAAQQANAVHQYLPHS